MQGHMNTWCWQYRSKHNTKHYTRHWPCKLTNTNSNCHKDKSQIKIDLNPSDSIDFYIFMYLFCEDEFCFCFVSSKPLSYCPLKATTGRTFYETNRQIAFWHSHLPCNLFIWSQPNLLMILDMFRHERQIEKKPVSSNTSSYNDLVKRFLIL